MIVSELIEKLKDMPQDAEVCTTIHLGNTSIVRVIPFLYTSVTFGNKEMVCLENGTFPFRMKGGEL